MPDNNYNLYRDLYYTRMLNAPSEAYLEIDRKSDISVSVREVAAPVCGENDVLVRVKAAGVNPLDYMITRGEVKLIVPYAFPLVMGNELAGVVEAVGAKVTSFAPGDRVYGRLPLGKIGAFAQLCAVDAGALAKIPDYLSFEEAAAVPLTALTAMQAFELLNAKAGDTVFLSGGTGSLGAMAIPILKAKGLRVITSGSAKNRERVMSIFFMQSPPYLASRSRLRCRFSRLRPAMMSSLICLSV